MVMSMTYARRNSNVKRELHGAAFSMPTSGGTLLYMARKPAVPRRFAVHHFIKQWREYRGLTQSQLVSRLEELSAPGVPTTTASLSRLENGLQPYSQPVLEALAEALQIDPGSLIMRNPKDREAIWTIWDRADIGQRQQIIKVADALVDAIEDPDTEKRNGTDG